MGEGVGVAAGVGEAAGVGDATGDAEGTGVGEVAGTGEVVGVGEAACTGVCTVAGAAPVLVAKTGANFPRVATGWGDGATAGAGKAWDRGTILKFFFTTAASGEGTGTASKAPCRPKARNQMRTNGLRESDGLETFMKQRDTVKPTGCHLSSS